MCRNTSTVLFLTSFRFNRPPSGCSNFYRSDSSSSSLSNLCRSNLPPDHTKTDEEPMSEFLWRGAYCRMGIKDFLLKQESFCEHTWEVLTYMVITGKGCSGLDIWPETYSQGTGTEEMILTT